MYRLNSNDMLKPVVFGLPLFKRLKPCSRKSWLMVNVVIFKQNTYLTCLITTRFEKCDQYLLNIYSHLLTSPSIAVQI